MISIETQLMLVQISSLKMTLSLQVVENKFLNRNKLKEQKNT